MPRGSERGVLRVQCCQFFLYPRVPPGCPGPPPWMMMYIENMMSSAFQVQKSGETSQVYRATRLSPPLILRSSGGWGPPLFCIQAFWTTRGANSASSVSFLGLFFFVIRLGHIPHPGNAQVQNVPFKVHFTCVLVHFFPRKPRAFPPPPEWFCFCIALFVFHFFKHDIFDPWCVFSTAPAHLGSSVRPHPP